MIAIMSRKISHLYIPKLLHQAGHQSNASGTSNSISGRHLVQLSTQLSQFFLLTLDLEFEVTLCFDHAFDHPIMILGIYNPTEVVGFVFCEIRKSKHPLLDVDIHWNLTISQLILLNFSDDASNLGSFHKVDQGPIEVRVAILAKRKIGQVGSHVGHARKRRCMQDTSIVPKVVFVGHRFFHSLKLCLILFSDAIPGCFHSTNRRAVKSRNELHETVKVVQRPQLFANVENAFQSVAAFFRLCTADDLSDHPVRYHVELLDQSTDVGCILLSIALVPGDAFFRSDGTVEVTFEFGHLTCEFRGSDLEPIYIGSAAVLALFRFLCVFCVFGLCFFVDTA
mmetsp:Transcript_24541/g.61549  ORF Transcript_24541/g.61549 Transcript_24541/m.61549 type:complete len:338 (-) Transcript_24541:1590-2603(-)